MLNRTLFSHLADVVDRDSDKTLIIFEDEKISASEFLKAVRNLASRLKSLGLGPGDRFSYCGENHPLVLACVFAASYLDVTFFPIAAIHSPTADKNVRDLGAKLVISNFDFSEISVSGIDEIWNHARSAKYDSSLEAEPTSQHPRLVFATSGTSGPPKFVALPESHLRANIATAWSTEGITARDVALSTLSICHSGGLCIQTLPSLCAGATVVLAAGFSVMAFRDLAQKYAPTITLTVPGHLQLMRMSNFWQEPTLNHFRLIGIGSALLPAHLARAGAEKGLKLMNIYGLTEAGPCAVTGWIDDSSIGKDDAVAIGQVREGISVRLSKDGEILIRGAAVGGFYIDARGSRAMVDAEGWFATGDVGFLENGVMYLSGRSSEFMNIGGMKVHPSEIEDTVVQMKGVRACAVVSRTHSAFGEVLVAYVELESSGSLKKTEIVRYCKQKLARYKVPREIVFVQSLPRSAVGKILRAKLRDGAA